MTALIQHRADVNAVSGWLSQLDGKDFGSEFTAKGLDSGFTRISQAGLAWQYFLQCPLQTTHG